MNLILKPSLEHIALVQITATLFNQHDIRYLVKKFSNSLSISELSCFPYPHPLYEKQNEWKEIEDKVKDKVPVLAIPTSLNEKLLCYIQSMGIQILRWIEYHFVYCSFDLGLLNGFCWTPLGTLDKKKTAEVLIRDEAIDITTRYKLACIYCLEDAIPELWYKLPENYKRSFYNEENIENNIQKELLIFWGQYIRAKEDNMVRRLNSISFSLTYMFQCSARTGNKAGTEYFLKKLIEDKHSMDEILLKAAVYVAKERRNAFLLYTEHSEEYRSEVFCFLLSQLNDEQQVQLFEKCPIQTLHCLLYWPWQNFFLETANRLSNFLPDNYEVLQIIIRKVVRGFEDYNYQKLFQDVWQQMPHAQKINLLNDNKFHIIFNMLLEIKDQESIKFIFQTISLTERKKLIFSDMGQSLFDDLIFQDEWDLLKFCVPLFISSKNEMVKFKEEFQEYFIKKNIKAKELVAARRLFPSAETTEISKSKQEIFFELLDDFIHGYDKRKSLKVDSSNPAKKLCNN